MPVGFFKALLPRDLDAVVAYLRSVKPIRNEVALPVYRMPVHHQPYPHAEAGFTEAMMVDPVQRGRYLVTIGHCMECHSPLEKGVFDYTRLGRGGRFFGPEQVQGLPSQWRGATSRNITSHPSAGIGAWTDAQIKRAFTRGVSRDAILAAISATIAWGPLVRKRISRLTAETLPWYLRLYGVMVGSSIPAAQHQWGSLCGISQAERYGAWTMADLCYLAMTGKKPTPEQALPLLVLIGLLISNGPGAISLQGAKGAVSADGPRRRGACRSTRRWSAS